MSSHLCISIQFLNLYSHGRQADGDPEWPPSPLRLLQALVSASAGNWNERTQLESAVPALRWLQSQPPPIIRAPTGITVPSGHLVFVPDNTADLLIPAWKRGEITKQVSRTEKVVRPARLNGNMVHYIYPLGNDAGSHLENLVTAARSISHFGWGIDVAVGNASLLSSSEIAMLEGHRWMPSKQGGNPLRVSRDGTLDDLMRRHDDFLNRITADGFHPVAPLRVFDIVHYRREDEPLSRPFRLFELRTLDGERERYPHSRLVHVAGMVRHLAIKAMTANPPRGFGADWVESYVAGHRGNSIKHRQLSYVPLPSLGHPHTNPAVRRFMLVAPPGDEELLEYVARRIAGQQLEPLVGNEFPDRDPPLLVPIRGDNVTKYYTEPTNVWHSFTPVILPGHDDHKPAKTRKLIEKALLQSGIDIPCEFEWSAISQFRKALSAHKYTRDNRPSGYWRPDHLLSQSATHLTLRFQDEIKVPGPLLIGAGRHCGFGLMATLDD